MQDFNIIQELAQKWMSRGVNDATTLVVVTVHDIHKSVRLFADLEVRIKCVRTAFFDKMRV